MAGNREISGEAAGPVVPDFPSLRDDIPQFPPARPAEAGEPQTDWRRSLSDAVRDPAELLELLRLPADLLPAARQAAGLFPLVVPRSFVSRMKVGDPADPLLRQVLPFAEELDVRTDLVLDPVGDSDARIAPGLLQKYEGRALLVSTGVCAVNCRYCFRRHYPYGDEPRRLDDWQPAIDALAADDTLHEAILSGGDPLVLTDARLAALVERLESIPHLKRLRIHSRLPIVLPDRITSSLIDLLRDSRLQAVMVVHANHAHEIQGDCAEALRTLVRSGIPTLNQAVLLNGVNDSVAALAALCESLGNLGVLPYYLHQFDRVAGAGHFEVAEARGLELVEQLRAKLSGYLVPRYVREIAGRRSKTPL
ncbi:L-lysine 2,3-aminomutase [Caulifigura coniformis]|uniref:L-lysine 2,3-aminomutase n=1 Tax=Caulifigura coniformis TaxID=2527983 RepID=A0A517SDR3_9PLAN|nr:EF-P beta-lysylation protein EpmB [Caulifigura coniformis]QDT54260.1 L-lysine 2,3-aminomutase [Caulifigura coniformis]